MAEGSGGSSEGGGQEVGLGSRRDYSSAQRVYLDELEQGRCRCAEVIRFQCAELIQSLRVGIGGSSFQVVDFPK